MVEVVPNTVNKGLSGLRRALKEKVQLFALCGLPTVQNNVSRVYGQS